VFTCFIVTLGFGLRMGGGIGEYLEFDENALGSVRYFIDFGYYALVLIILLNIVFGIIIDTFSELREKKKARLEDTREKCFMCGIDKATFDRGGSTVFQNHIKEEHNMWAYLKFVVAIWEQDEDDDDGLESYVRKCIQDRDHEWLPSAKCIRLPNHKEGDDAHGSTQHEILKQMSDLDSKVNQVMSAIADLTQAAKIRTE
jgi:inositol 1,4,5-triphosphate receptor type 1